MFRLISLPYNRVIEQCFVITACMITLIYFVFKLIYNKELLLFTIIISGILLISTFIPIIKKDAAKGHSIVILSVLILFLDSLKKQNMWAYLEILYNVLLFLYYMR